VQLKVGENFPNKFAHCAHEPSDWSAEHPLGSLKNPSVRAEQVLGVPVYGETESRTNQYAHRSRKPKTTVGGMIVSGIKIIPLTIIPLTLLSVALRVHGEGALGAQGRIIRFRKHSQTRESHPLLITPPFSHSPAEHSPAPAPAMVERTDNQNCLMSEKGTV